MNLNGSLLYKQSSFTLPAVEKKMTAEEWEIATGQRCENCLQKIETSFEEHVCKGKE